MKNFLIAVAFGLIGAATLSAMERAAPDEYARQTSIGPIASHYLP